MTDLKAPPEASIPDFRGHSAGRDFENVILQRLTHESDRKNCHAGRYGVQVAIVGKERDGRPKYQPMRSLPDFEGTLPGGRQFIFDAKVCSASKFDLQDYRLNDEVRGSKCRQLRHLLQRSSFGVVAFFLIHWNSRELKTKSEPAETFAFPVRRECPFWRAFLMGEIKAIRRADCHELGARVRWNRLSRSERKVRPDVLAAVRLMDRRSTGSDDFLLHPVPEWKKQVAPIKPET